MRSNCSKLGPYYLFLIIVCFVLLICHVTNILCKNNQVSASQNVKHKKVSIDSTTKKSGETKMNDFDDYEDEEMRGLSKSYSKSSREKWASKKSAGYQDSSSKEEEDDYDSIEDANEEKIDEIIRENDKNLLILFYDRESKCPACKSALEKLEEVDDDLEATGYIEVVKSRNRRLAREFGIFTLPAMVYFRRKHPVLYDGTFDLSDELYRWVRSHDYLVTEDLDDGNFEDKTDSYSPDMNSLDWFVLFYDSKKIECNSYVPTWETVAHQLKGLVNLGKVDMHESDDVAQRFNVDDDDDCPTFILFRKGKMYRYKEASRDIKNFVNFALQKYKENRGRRVPEPPTLIEELYEEFKEHLASKFSEHLRFMLTIGFLLVTCSLIGLAIWYFKFYNKSLTSSDHGTGEKKKDL